MSKIFLAGGDVQSPVCGPLAAREEILSDRRLEYNFGLPPKLSRSSFLVSVFVDLNGPPANLVGTNLSLHQTGLDTPVLGYIKFKTPK